MDKGFCGVYLVAYWFPLLCLSGVALLSLLYSPTCAALPYISGFYDVFDVSNPLVVSSKHSLTLLTPGYHLVSSISSVVRSVRSLPKISDCSEPHEL